MMDATDEKRLPPHITEDDIRLITQIVLPTVEAAVRADSMTIEEHAALCGEMEALEEQLSAAQAVIAEAAEYVKDQQDVPAGGVENILAQMPNDALQAVKAATWDEGADAVRSYDYHNSPIVNPYRAIVLEPSTPEQEGKR